MTMLDQQVNPGEQLDQFRIEDIVGRGATAIIFRAIDLHTHQKVAIKLPRLELESDPAFSDRFRREAEIGETLDHSGIVKVIPSEGRTRPYIVMEWFEGKPLSQLMSEEKLTPECAVRISISICKALEYIHNRGIVHRDLRPEHILVNTEDQIKLIDFGAAGQEAAARRITFTSISQLTGGSEYVSPEELKGKRGDARSDIYAVGIMLYEIVTGRKPFAESDAFDRTVNDPVPPRVINPAISPQLQEVIYRALERDPRNRYAIAHDFTRDLQHLDQVGLADRAELRDWKKGRSLQPTKVVLYVAMALIPIAIFGLLLYLAGH
jgi:eukaryotic-like serine/threonine-protein kinase